MRKIIRLSEKEDMWFPADDRIYISVNEAFSSAVKFFPVAEYKYQYEPSISDSRFFISIEEDVSYAFLAKKYLIPLFSKKYNAHRPLWTNNGYEPWGINYYSKREISIMFEQVERLIGLLENDYTNPILRQELNTKMLIHLKGKLDMLLYYVMLMDKDEQFNFMISNRAVIIDFYRRFMKYIRIMFKKEPHKQYLCVLGP